MAGESPDRSKQRESSAEPTSGSASAVPEAREPRDSREVRDPRVAVAREAEPSASRGGVDTATRVFSVRDLKTAESEQPEASAEPEEGEEPTGTEDGDEATASESAEDATEAEEPEGGAGADDAEEPAEATEATEATEAENSATAARTGSTEAEDAESGPEDAQDGPEGAEAAESASRSAGGASGGSDERLREAVAQWVASADDKSSAPEPATDSAADGGASDEDTSDRGTGAEAEERSASDTAVADGSDEPGKADDPSDAKPGAEAQAASGAASESTPKSAAKPAPKWASDTDEEAAEDAEPGRAEDADTGTGTDADADEPDHSPVDQPTAVFKAPRPKPAVDQPTTMLKLGGATKPEPDEDEAAPKDAPKAGRPAEPEAPAERTSKFVALKPLDEPRPPKQADVTALVPQVGPERTTQQPLPPRPPLDLLAELTNTPPPPPTPLRTLGRRLKIWTPLVILLLVAFAIAQAVRPLPATALALTAEDSYTFEGGKTQLPWPSEGQGWMDADGVGTVGSFGKQTPVAIGSVAKTMTAYIILKDHPMKAGEEGPEIEVDATAEKEGGYDVSGDESTLNTVKAGDRLTEKQALSAVLIPSANNIARLLARWDAGTEAAFVKKMNATAKELGMSDTTYTDPSGLKETTVSTAEDQVKLGRAFVKVPALVSISSAASWTDPSGKYWNNYNTLPYYIGAIGIKTGSTTAAGGNLLFASRKKVNGQTVTLVGAVLGQHKPKILETVNAVSKTALLAAQDALTSAKILKKGDVVGYVDDQLGGRTPVVITKDVSAVGWAGMTVKLSFTADDVPHTAKAGTQVGTLTVGDGTSSAVKVPVALQSDLTEPGFSDKLTRIG
ncbi:D-alanyl-D-alanine carboxypeptidase [Streptomyces sp. SLBN-115]|uniref:D-alanyl-D-alanine carboxypeptidase n=1 Tax=Streptomyces sp. SLBN-115 TaxID=2768453 RepID=UPI00116EFDBF|nr:D-alanyl-D-alanine carboxypeptidase [Streptomyces sp. SLBN-115]TQJ53750.1 D-alanyl-D-alanine carboxypeptidase [Streptomyces sp. SLBN-115]